MIILSCIFLGACTPAKSPSNSAITAIAANQTPAGMMNAFERDLGDTLDPSYVSIRRVGELLAVTLKGDCTFGEGAWTVRPELGPTLDSLADVLNKYPKTAIRIEGHTDNRGAESANLKLSKKRAENVGDCLIRRGVDASRVTTAFFGESLPAASNDNEDGRILNRRVEIRIEPSD